jgi:NAD+ synthase (glutamine-hydrolysing)
MNRHGFARVSVCSPEVVVGSPAGNAGNTLAMLRDVADSDVVVFPELGLTGYTCGDLFRQDTLLKAAEAEVARICREADTANKLLVVGVPVRVMTELFNCAVVIHAGQVIGVVPKQNIPNYNEFYESRHFGQADGDEVGTIDYAGFEAVPFGVDLLFPAYKHPELVAFVEICEDLWMPVPPSSVAAVNGATLLLNLSASNEVIAKHEYRTTLVQNQSGRCVAGYAYACAGPTESTSDLVFAGHCLIAENGSLLAESGYVGDGKLQFGPRYVTADVDCQRVTIDRQVQRSFGDSRKLFFREFRQIEWTPQPEQKGLKRYVPATPFVPTDPAKLAARCAAVFDIQCAALAKRLKTANFPDLSIGISGGLDSTHALVVTHKTLQALGLPPTKIKAKTMPGFGTTEKTRRIAHELMKGLGVPSDEIDIRPACFQTFKDLKHKPFGLEIEGMSLEQFSDVLRKVPADKRHDLVFENVQARMRTLYLMNSGFVIGTGDMSELTLGWATYNGDHMSMYNVNCSVPKTLVKFMVEHVARHHYGEGPIRSALLETAGLTISPELLPAGEGDQILQSTEATVGPYVINDFCLLNFVRYGFGPEKILFLMEHSDLAKKHSAEEREKTLRTFLTRFFSQQFKRNCVPDGPKVGTVSLSPRGDWRMPSDAAAQAWLDELTR